MYRPVTTADAPYTHGMLRDGVHELLRKFCDSPIGQQLHDVDRAKGRCKPASLTLLGLMHERGMTDAELLNFNREGEQHYVIQLDGLIIDPSARQFPEHAMANVPIVVPYDDFAKAWDPGPLPVDFADVWNARFIHRVGDKPPEWRSAREGLPDVDF